MTTSTENPIRSACPPAEDVVASVVDPAMGHLDSDGPHHVDTCPVCRMIAQDARQVGAVLNAGWPDTASRDLLPRILAGLPADAWGDAAAQPCSKGLRFARFRPLGLAAGLLLAVGVSWLVIRGAPHKPDAGGGATVAAITRGAEWLRAQQLPGGGWDVVGQGGQREYAPALTGLAVLALARHGEAIAMADSTIRRAAASLVEQQAESGRIGEEFDGVMYNQGIATLALLESFHITGDESLREPITRALACIARRQDPAGGWGYASRVSGAPNTSITAWQMMALLVALQQGWDAHESAILRGVAWMSGTVDDAGFFGYEYAGSAPGKPNTLTMMGAYCLLAAREAGTPVPPSVLARARRGVARLVPEGPDNYHEAFFYTLAVRACGPNGVGGAVAAVSDLLVEKQNGRDSRVPWLPDDQWGRTGGRIYSTSMALLTLSGS